MTLTLTIPAIVYLVAVVLGTTISLVCWSYPYTAKSFRLLGAAVFSITWTLFIFFLLESELINSLPHLFQTSSIGSLLYIIFSYLFLRSYLHGKGLTRKDLIHVVPLAVFLIDYSATYFLSASEKLQLIASDKSAGYIYRNGWLFSGDLHRTFRFLLFIIYFGLQLHTVVRSTNSHRNTILYHLSAQFLIGFYYIIYLLTHEPDAWRIISVIISAYLAVVAVALMLHPNILYDIGEKFRASIPNGNPDDRRSLHNDKRIKQICRRLEDFMAAESPYRRHGYSLSDLSAALNIPSYQLSTILNQNMKLSFQEYINKHRIDYCKNRILEGAAETITLEALAYECGFNNRNSFTAAFKQFSGTTPSDFLKTQKNQQPAAKVS